MWVGSAPYPDMVKYCMKLWKKYLSDYELKLWNEGNFNIVCCNCAPKQLCMISVLSVKMEELVWDTRWIFGMWKISVFILLIIFVLRP